MRATIRPTIIFVRHREIGGVLYHHAAEVPPNLLSESEIALGLDAGWLKEYSPDERRSPYRIFHHFTGCAEKQPLEQQELASMTLTQ